MAETGSGRTISSAAQIRLMHQCNSHVFARVLEAGLQRLATFVSAY